MLVFQRENVLLCLEELIPLWTKNRGEVGQISKVPYVLDWSTIVGLGSSNSYALYTVRDDGVIVGYTTYILTRLLQHAGYVIGLCETIWIEKDYRKGANIVFELLTIAEIDLMKNGVCAVRYSSIPTFKPKKGGVGKLWRFWGARPIEYVYEKVLTPETGGKRGRQRTSKQRTAKYVHSAVS